MQINPHTATVQEMRDELARRIRGYRMVSHANDPARGYRRSMNLCRLGRASYHRLAGIPKVMKDGSKPPRAAA